MEAIPQLQPPTTPKDDEIDLRQLAEALQRQWRLIARVAGGALVVSTVYALITPRVWEGEFQIVLTSKTSTSDTLAQLTANNPILDTLSGGGGSESSLATEVKVLESPSVLKPVFDFVRSTKQRAGKNTDGMRFSSWVKSVKVELVKGTSVLNISYTDTDKTLIVPVIQRISRDYQIYSGRNRRRDMVYAVNYLKKAIADFTPKAEASMQRAQAYALSNSLGLADGIPAGRESAGSSSSVETSRQEAQTKLLLLRQQLAQARGNGNRMLFQSPELVANSELYRQYQATEGHLSDLRSRLRDNDELVRNLQRLRLSLIATLNQQTIDKLQSEMAIAQAALQASSRPKEVVLKHRELVRKAIRDEKTLAELENQLQITQLEQAKQTEPWELISTPTMLDAPVAPKRSQIMALGVLAGLVAGCGAALVVDRRSGRVFSKDELQQLLPGPLLAQLNPSDATSLEGQLTLLALGPLAGSQRVGLIPVGLPSQGPQLQRLLTALRQRMPRTELHCDHDLVEAASCDHQLLVTRLGAPTRSQLASLRQQLQLQGRPITGWLLLDDTRVA
jgi:succinoglycan biosynthesis transport protein ExoP